MKKLLSLALICIIGLSSCTNNYSEGNRTGIITKASSKGLIWKTTEVDLKVAPGIASGSQMIGQYEDFWLSIDNDKTINCTTPIDSINLYMQLGIPVDIQYQEVRGFNWFSNRGESDYFIKSIKRNK